MCGPSSPRRSGLSGRCLRRIQLASRDAGRLRAGGDLRVGGGERGRSGGLRSGGGRGGGGRVQGRGRGGGGACCQTRRPVARRVREHGREAQPRQTVAHLAR
eukprot:3612483-Rhodomonas_salina.1